MGIVLSTLPPILYEVLSEIHPAVLSSMFVRLSCGTEGTGAKRGARKSRPLPILFLDRGVKNRRN